VGKREEQLNSAELRKHTIINVNTTHVITEVSQMAITINIIKNKKGQKSVNIAIRVNTWTFNLLISLPIQVSVHTRPYLGNVTCRNVGFYT
jgi:hypothetical protein